MKSIKAFEIITILNFAFCLSFVVLLDIRNLYFNRSFFLTGFIILNFSFLLIIGPFCWTCISLVKDYKCGLQMSKRAKIFGIVLSLLYTVLLFFLIYGSFDLINRFFNYRIKNDWLQRTAIVLLWLSTITSIYLAISYWMIRKQINLTFAQSVSQIGLQSKSVDD